MSEMPSSAPANIAEKQGIENHGFLDLGDVIEILDPVRVKGPRSGALSGVSIDTRKPMGDDYVFWAIKGRHFNGNDFVEQAIESGVRAAVVSRKDILDKPLNSDVTLILVKDTLVALQTLAAVYRSRFDLPVLGITGSNGKTLVKEMLAAILRRDREIYRSPLSYNTQVGAALSLLGLRPEHDLAIIEAGISRPGEMDRLERMIRPDHGILTVISKAHIGGLVSLENTLEQKSRLFANLDRDSLLLLNADDPLSMSLASRSNCRTVSFGLGADADVTAENIESIPGEGSEFTVRLFGESIDVMVPAPGEFNIRNALAAAAAAKLFGASARTIREGLADFHPSPMRMEIHTTVTGVTLINDTYNSDPASMKGALDVLAKAGRGRRKIAILSDMLDLGAHSAKEHSAMGKEVVRANVDHLITVGENAALMAREAVRLGMNSRVITNTGSYGEAAGELEKIMNRDDVVLFKGSRWFRLDLIAKELVGSIGPTRLVVDLDAIATNIKTIRGIVGDKTAIMAVVKSFGYGNDSIRTSRVALENGVNHLAVAFPDEGAALRENRIEAPILVLNVFPEECDKVVRYDLGAVVSSVELARSLNDSALPGRKIPVHVKVDTGMGRSGVWVDDAPEFIEAALSFPNLAVEGLMTHFACADDPNDDEYTRGQIAAFQGLIDEMAKRGVRFRHIHAGNTAAVVRFPETHFTMVRPGLGIYGMYPSEAVKELIPLEQVIIFSTKIAQIKEHPPGRCISYNRRFVTCRPCKIATLPVGYNDGYPRFQTNIGQVLVRGKRCPVVGTVCMDTTMIDVTDVPDVSVGDEAVLIGRQGDEEILPDEIAANGGTINYEIVCKISPRVTRIFVQS